MLTNQKRESVVSNCQYNSMLRIKYLAYNKEILGDSSNYIPSILVASSAKSLTVEA